MKYLAAYLLIQKGGRANPSARDITHLLESVGSEVDPKSIEALLAAVKDKNVEDLIAEGAKKLSAVPVAGAAPAAAAEGDAAEDGDKDDEEEEEEEDDDLDMDGGMDLFG